MLAPELLAHPTVGELTSVTIERTTDLLPSTLVSIDG
jgi:hypothetical protein